MLSTRVRAGPAAGFVLSVIFAAIFTVISVGDLYLSSFAPSLGEPAPVTLRVPYGPRIVRDLAGGRAHLAYTHARLIVARGTMLDEANDDHRAAFAYESTRR